MVIADFTREHISEASALAIALYEEERRQILDLPAVHSLLSLSDFADNGLGSVAFENGRMVGFLCSYPPFDNVFGSTEVKGVFSPMGANGAVGEKRERIYAAMYQHSARKWVGTGAVSHAVCLYAHDEAAQRQFYQYGFGLRCVDAIRPMEPFKCLPCDGYEYLELDSDALSSAYPFEVMLNQHYQESPFFMNRRLDTWEEFITQCRQENQRCFAAYFQGQPCAYLKISGSGETSITEAPSYRHITGAFCLPGHRGCGVYQNLLNYVIHVLKEEGYTHLGVDFESFNPAAYGFWLKYFKAYTHGVVRRIDEMILNTL